MVPQVERVLMQCLVLLFLLLCQVMEKVRQVCDESQQSHEREKRLQEEISSRLAKEKEVSANAEVFNKSLQELQVSLFNPGNQLAGEEQHRAFLLV